MRVWPAAFSVGALSLLSLASGVVVEFNKNFMSATPNDRITFATSEMHPLRQNLLMTMDGYYSSNDRVSCNVTEEKVNSGTVTVLLAISKCLNESSINLIETWVDQIKDEKMTYFKDGGDYEIEFTTTLVPGQCEARSESNKKGFANKFDDSWQEGELMLLSEDVQPGEIDRISAFARFGRVLDAVPTDPNDVPIAVISFVNNEKSFDVISQYERVFKISNTFNFQICQSGESCDGHFENCLLLQEGVDLFMYNPFTIVRSFHCSMLDGGIPVSYVDDDGARQCFCSCPLGFEQHEDSYGNYYCDQVIPDTCPCTWSTHPFGFKHANTEYLETCYFSKISTEWGVPAPFPSDNYVADSRINDHDDSIDLENGPHIDVSVTPQYKNVYDYISFVQFMDLVTGNGGDYTEEALPPNFREWAASIGFNGDADLFPMSISIPAQELGDTEVDHYTWRDYQVTRESKIDDLAFTSYGRYLLEVNANDYTHSAQCQGCVAIVDQYRPKHTTECPVSFCDNTTSLCHGYDVSTSELIPANVDRANTLVQAVYTYQSEAKNDACSSGRCDYEDFSLKNFFEDEYCSTRSYNDYGPKCFNLEEIEQDLFVADSKMLVNPLVVNGKGVVQDRVVVPEGQCTRCCSYTTKLREYWTDYTCGYDYDTQRCSGDASEECSFNQCLVLFGETVATAVARINPEVVEESERVIENLVQKGFQSHTQIHRALQCSSFGGSDGDCSFRATVSDLIETQVLATFLSDVDPNNYVFWRYSIGDSMWNLVGHEEETYEFNQAQTKITLEAWTQCGLVRKFYFYVHLHLNSDIRVCDKFSEMWYQTSVSRLSVDADLCAYPSSDFAELTFDYHPNVGLQYARDQLRMNVTDVSCSMSIQGRDPVEILSVEAESPEIVERFAVELINNVETGEETNVHVSCDFTYTLYDDSTLTHTCERDFTIVDCNGPEFDVPHGECKFEDCAGVDAPGPFEACGGKIIKSTADSTYLDDEEVECCQACGDTVTTCEAILGLPNEADDIKRCVPQFESGIYDYEDQTFDQSTGLMAVGKSFVANNAAMTAVLSASAMVALVALIVIRRRRAAEQKASMDDAYFPLLH